LTADALGRLLPSRKPPHHKPPDAVDRDQNPPCSVRSLPDRTLGSARISSSGHSRLRLSDERLIELCRRGDEAAFETIVERYRAPLLRHCQGIAAEDAQDAVQQAFIEAWSALRSGTEVRHLRAWLFTIARRAALQGLRRRGERSSELPESLAGRHSSAEQFEQAATTREIFAAITDLPGAEHDALVSMSFHGRSARATARDLGVSEGAARQLVFRARARVRAAARAFVPPIPAFRLLRGPGHARRITALGHATPGASPAAIGTLSKLAAIALLAVGVGAPIVALRGGQEASPSPVSQAAEPGVAPRSSARSAAPGTPRSRHHSAASRRSSPLPRASAGAVVAGSTAPGSPAREGTLVGGAGEATGDSGKANSSGDDHEKLAGTSEPVPSTLVEEAKHASVGVTPPLVAPTIPAPATSAGQVAAEAEAAVDGAAGAVGGVVQETVPVQPHLPASLP